LGQAVGLAPHLKLAPGDFQDGSRGGHQAGSGLRRSARGVFPNSAPPHDCLILICRAVGQKFVEDLVGSWKISGQPVRIGSFGEVYSFLQFRGFLMSLREVPLGVGELARHKQDFPLGIERIALVPR